MLEVKGQGQPCGHDIGRWAPVNVKLHFFKFIDWHFQISI